MPVQEIQRHDKTYMPKPQEVIQAEEFFTHLETAFREMGRRCWLSYQEKERARKRTVLI